MTCKTRSVFEGASALRVTPLGLRPFPRRNASMKKLALLIPTLALAAWVVSGCGHSNVAGPSAASSGSGRDQALVAAEAARQVQFVDDGFYELPTPMTTALTAPGGALSVQE